MTLSAVPSKKLPTYKARERNDNVWDIAMYIPHATEGGGCTVESILLVPRNCGIAPPEDEIAHRVCALLNMASHIPNEDLQIKGASLKLQTLNKSVGPSPEQQVYDSAMSAALEALRSRVYPEATFTTDTHTLILSAVSRIDSLNAAQSSPEQEPELTDREKDLRDTNDALRLALKVISKKFGVNSSDPQMIVASAVEAYDKLGELERRNRANAAVAPMTQAQADRNDRMDKMGQALERLATLFHISANPPNHLADHVIAQFEKSDNLAKGYASQAQDYCERLSKAMDTINTITHAMSAAGHHEEGADLLLSTMNMLGRFNDGEAMKLQREMTTQNYENAKAISEAAALLKEKDTLLREASSELDTVKEVLSKRNNDMRLVALALGYCDGDSDDISALATERMNMIELLKNENVTLKEHEASALVLHNNICDLINRHPSKSVPVIPFGVLFNHLKAEYEGPRNAIRIMAENFELEPETKFYPDAVSAIYHYVKGLSVAQYKHDQQLQALFADRNDDRSIIGAIDDLLGDITRPTPPITAAIRSLVRSHLNAISNKEKSNG